MDVAPLIVVTDPRGRIKAINSHCEAATGYAAAALRGQPVWQNLVGEADAPRVERSLRVMAGGAHAEDEFVTWIRRDGEPLNVLCSYACPREASGEPCGFVIAAADVRGMRQLQTELGESLDLYQGILDTAVDAIVTLDERGLMQSFNRAAERIFGYRASEVIGRNVAMLMPAPYREVHDHYIQNYLTTRRKKIIGIGREVQGLRKDGTLFPLDLAVGEVMMPGRRLFTGILRDITDRKEAEAEAHRRLAELAHVTRLRSMGDLAIGLAHEINQPLTAIISYAQACQRMLLQDDPDIGLLREALASVATQGERAAEVIRRLRRHVEKDEIEQAATDLGEAVEQALKLLSHDLGNSQVKVELDSPEDLPAVQSDRVQIEQVILNLVRNAIDAMREIPAQDRLLRVQVRPAVVDLGAGLLVTVSDRGPGFVGTTPEAAFAPFFTTKPDGLGQGLSICRRIIEAHGGRIWAEQLPGAGAAFKFWLPQA